MIRVLPLFLLIAGLSCGSALGQEQAPVEPPQDMMKLSEIIAKVEQRDGFRYIGEIDWDEEGYYQVVYFTTDKAKVEIHFDPATGEPK